MRAEIFWSKTAPQAIIPTKRDEDGGFDLYACMGEYVDMEIAPLQTVRIPLGIASAFSDDYVFLLRERSSTAKYGLSLRSGVIDSGYRGEWQLMLTNVSRHTIHLATKDTPVSMSEGDVLYPLEKALAQAILLPLPKTDCHEIPYAMLLEMESQRGTGWSGSSGK